MVRHRFVLDLNIDMSAALVRRYLNLVEGRKPDLGFVSEHDVSTGETILIEGIVADRIKSAMSKVSERFGRPTPEILERVSKRAGSLTGGIPVAQAVIARAKALGRSQALLAAMIGVCGAMIGFSSDPARAQQAAEAIQPILALHDVNQIIDQLARHGITIKSDVGSAVQLPAGLSPIVITAAHALKAIADYQYVEGGKQESTRELRNQTSIIGGIQKEGARFAEKVSLWTADHSLLLAEYSTVFEVENGFPTIVTETSAGVRPELIKAFNGLTEVEQNQISNFINQNGTLSEHALATRSASTLVRAKGNDICALVARLAVRSSGVARRVILGPSGIRVF